MYSRPADTEVWGRRTGEGCAVSGRYLVNYLDDITKVVWISIHMYPIHVGKLIKKRREVYVKA